MPDPTLLNSWSDGVPSLTFQLAMLPSVIVGDIAGIVNS